MCLYGVFFPYIIFTDTTMTSKCHDTSCALCLCAHRLSHLFCDPLGPPVLLQNLMVRTKAMFFFCFLYFQPNSTYVCRNLNYIGRKKKSKGKRRGGSGGGKVLPQQPSGNNDGGESRTPVAGNEPCLLYSVYELLMCTYTDCLFVSSA